MLVLLLRASTITQISTPLTAELERVVRRLRYSRFSQGKCADFCRSLVWSVGQLRIFQLIILFRYRGVAVTPSATCKRYVAHVITVSSTDLLPNGEPSGSLLHKEKQCRITTGTLPRSKMVWSRR